MPLLRRAPRTEVPQTKIQARISRLPTSELGLMTENTIAYVGRELSQWQRSGIPADLHESDIEQNAEILLELVRELKRRIR